MKDKYEMKEKRRLVDICL